MHAHSCRAPNYVLAVMSGQIRSWSCQYWLQAFLVTFGAGAENIRFPLFPRSQSTLDPIRSCFGNSDWWNISVASYRSRFSNFCSLSLRASKSPGTGPYDKVHLYSRFPLRIKIIYCSLRASSVSGNASLLTEMEGVRRTCRVRAKVAVDRVSRSVTRRNCVTLAKGVIRRCGRGTRGGGMFSGGFDGRRRVTK